MPTRAFVCLQRKPRLRGWSHAAAWLVAVGTTAALCVRTADDPLRQLSMLVYGLSTIALYGFSATYHLGSWEGRRDTLFRTLDHASIFVLIAGTYTAFYANILPERTRGTMLVVVWVLAVLGVAVTVFTFKLPRWIGVSLYIGMGWAAVIPALDVVSEIPPPAIATIVTGGLLYTIGAVIYTKRRPDPWPTTFGFHELFHIIVVAANTAFLAAIWFWVVPYPRP